jgi:hypothetical protein
MIYIIEIAGPSGGRATKSYESASIQHALDQAQNDLQGFPEYQITEVLPREEWDQLLGDCSG